MDSYESDQQRLRQQYGLEEAPEGEGDESGLDLGSIPEVNPEIYRDVEPVLFQGFLTVSARINGVPFVFKSLNHHEFQKLGMVYDLGGGPAAIQDYYNAFLAHGVLYADGLSILEDRNAYLGELKDFFQDLPRDARQTVIRHLSEVNRRSSKAVMLTEAYCVETTSRVRWAQLKGLDITSPAVTGFQGTESLGLNWGQMLWRAINHLEDQRENAEREWENTKFVASSMAGKGMQKIYSADKRRRTSEREERLERRERIIRHALLGTPLDEGQETHGPVKVARTVSELASQLEKDLKGEQDWHDKVISDHENRIREGAQSRMEKIRQMREEHLRKYGDRAVVMAPSEVGLTKKEVDRRIQERLQRQAETLAAKSQYPELFDPKYAEFTDKWINQQPIIQPAPNVMEPLDDERPRSKPFNGGK